ncbi:glucodextranase DOMON-like domain-containing protein [Thermococcus sp.]|uniref:glucodextranase DOMON-like domain-containing protein n=1 Tax=Thermococcus sp. TaxID=35749 RepID=UPI00261F4C37|nr:glucodextranase DOMON-like domain-containing protein [Thermococcus sp.]
MRKVFALFLAILVAGSIVGANLKTVGAAEPKPLNVVIVWHMHQPFYYDPVSKQFVLPWVRLHAVRDYWRMPAILSKYPDIHVTIDLSGSLIQQIAMYMNGSMDIRERISWKLANGEPLTTQEKWIMLQVPGGFFDNTIPWNGEPLADSNGNPIRKFWKRYTDLLNERNALFAKYANLPLNEQKVKITSSLSYQDYLDLAVLFNLAWLPHDYIMNNSKLKALYDKVNTGGYTRNDLKTVLDIQMELINHTFDYYKAVNKYLGNGPDAITFVPYAHPIGPILNDFGWESDFVAQIKKGEQLYKEYLGDGKALPNGGWEAECTLNDETLELLAENGWEWVISDQIVLERMGVPYNVTNYFRPWVADFNGTKIYIFPRDHELSDRIGFNYAGMNQEQAVNDFVNQLLEVQKQNYDGSLVYVIALDGENPWENYPYEGDMFLNMLYKKLEQLQKEGLIRTVTPDEYIQMYGDKANVLKPRMMTYLDLKDHTGALEKATSLDELYKLAGVKGPHLWPESSWVDGTLSTWIGDRQENMGWYWLYLARKTLFEHKSSMSSAEWNRAFEYLMRAEGSDWFWWYGPDQNSGFDQGFGRLFKDNLYEMYKLAGINPPSYLYGNYFPDGQPYLVRETVGLKKGQVLNYSSLSPYAKGVSVYFDSDGFHFIVKGNLSNFEISLWNPNRFIGNTFTIGQPVPKELTYTTFPYSAQSVGLMITTHVSYANGTVAIYNATGYDTYKLIAKLNATKVDGGIEVTVPFKYLESPTDVYFAVSTLHNGNLSVISTPVELKLPKQVKGIVLVDMKDPVGDDHGPGNYTYPTDKVFKPGVFDLTRFQLIEQKDSYLMVFYFRNLGGNPWNGPNGFSLQMIEAYFDFKKGGNTSAIKIYKGGPGANVNIDPHHPWDVAIRVEGWEDYVVLPNGTKLKDVLKVSVDPTKNAIMVTMPKEYMKLNMSYGLYGTVLIGSQDGYGPDHWRAVAVKAEQWRIGGGNPDAIIAGVAPRVIDELVPPGFKPTQEQQLSSYDAKNDKLATVLMIPLIKGTGGEQGGTSTQTSTTTTSTTATTTSTTPTTTTATSTTSTTTSQTTTTTTQATQTTSTTQTTGGGRVCGPALLVALAIVPILLRRRR